MGPLLLLFILLLAIFNALMDWSSEGLFESDYWNKNQGWWRKYKIIPITIDTIINKNISFYEYKNKWYHFGFAPRYEEKFIYSTTILVFLTDGWHLLQFLFHTTWQLAIALAIQVNGENTWEYKVAAFIIIKITFSLLFEIIYKIKKTKIRWGFKIKQLKN